MYASIVIPIQVISDHFTIFLDHLRYAAHAARRQTIPSEILIVDYNSNSKFIPAIKQVAHANHAIYVRDEREDTLWTRGRALNVGIKCAVGEAVLFVDADCIVPPQYVAEHVSLLNEETYTYSEFYLTTPDVRKTGHYASLAAQKDKLMPPYDTCCSHQGLLQKTIQKVGMFDEVYRGWGFEEHDYIRTLKNAGIKSQFCPAMPIHLYHPTWEKLMRAAGKAKEQCSSRSFNKARYFKYLKTGTK